MIFGFESETYIKNKIILFLIHILNKLFVIAGWFSAKKMINHIIKIFG
jgi:hypothetical protein